MIHMFIKCTNTQQSINQKKMEYNGKTLKKNFVIL